MLSFRYGQGSDYFGYQYLVSSYGSFINAILNPYHLHGEIGFRALGSMFNGNYKLFITCTSLYEMYMLRRFLILHCENKAFSLYLFFPTVFLTYYFSAIRQGLVIATFLGIGISLVEKKEWVKYYIMCMILISIHSVAFALLFLPVINTIELKSILTVGLPLSILIGFFLATPLSNIILSRVPIIGYRLASANRDMSIAALAERIVTLIFTIVSYLSIKSDVTPGKDPWWIKAYILGHIFFFVFLAFTNFATRIFICYKTLEVMFIPNIIKHAGKNRQVIISYFFLLMIVMYFHNVNGYIAQGGYYENINIFNYPYINIFDQNRLFEMRNPVQYFGLIE